MIDLRVTETTYNTVSLSWTKPTDKPGVEDEAKGYFVEVRPAESLDWQRCNPTPIILTSYTAKGLKPMAMYWVRVIATNEGGDGVPTDLDNYILAMPPPGIYDMTCDRLHILIHSRVFFPYLNRLQYLTGPIILCFPVRPKFTTHNMQSFMVVRAGNTVRINLAFEVSPAPPDAIFTCSPLLTLPTWKVKNEIFVTMCLKPCCLQASPWPDVEWLKDGMPIGKRVTISNSDGGSQLLIPSSERSDTGIYTIVVKNMVGQESFSIEVRVTGRQCTYVSPLFSVISFSAKLSLMLSTSSIHSGKGKGGRTKDTE